MDTKYAVIWFEGEGVYTLTDSRDHTVLLSASEAANDEIPILLTEDQINEADEDIRYAVPTDLLSDVFGWQE